MILIDGDKKDDGFMSGEKKVPFPITGKYFIGLEAGSMEREGFFPSKMIVPAWFGFRTFIETVSAHCPVEVTGRSQFKLFINGKSVLFGPCRSRKEVVYYDTLDFAPYLRVGENQILMQVFSYPENPPDRTQAGPNYCYGDDGGPAISLEGKLGDRDPGDPANWRVWLDKGIGSGDYGVFLTGATERVDGGLSAANPFFSGHWEDEGVIPAVIVQPWAYDPFGCRHGKVFLPRPIDLLYRKEKTFPVWQERTFAPGEEGRFVLDTGELTTAYFRIGFKGGKGARVKITYAESYYHKDECGRKYKGIRDDASGFIDGMYDEIVLDGDTVYEPFRFRTFRFIEVSVCTAKESLTILPQPYIETAYPLGEPKCPEGLTPEQQKLYEVAFRTLQLCAHDTYEDCPYYEQLQYACDTRLEILFTYASTGNTRLAAHAIDLFASSLQPNGFTQARFPSREDQIIPVFSLYFILMLEDYLNETGDKEFVRRYIPIAERIAETFLMKRCPDGLLAPQGYWDYFDWTQEWSDAFSTPTAVKNGESALQNLFFVYAVQSLCRMLPVFDRGDLAAAYERESAQILRLIEKSCFVPEKCLYKEGPQTEEYTQHTQIYAVLTGLAEGEKARQIMERVLADDSLVQCSFMQRFYLFRALEKAGMYDRTEALWKDWQAFIDLHCTTFPETPFDPRSDCHAWSALPLWEFNRNQ